MRERETRSKGGGPARVLPHSRALPISFPAGVNQFCQDIVDMIRLCPPWCRQLVPYFKACWVIFTPGMLMVGQAWALRSSCPHSSYGESLGSSGVSSHPFAILVLSAPFTVHSPLHLHGPVRHHTALRSVPVPALGPGAGCLHGGAELHSDSALGWHCPLQGVRDTGCCELGREPSGSRDGASFWEADTLSGLCGEPTPSRLSRNPLVHIRVGLFLAIPSMAEVGSWASGPASKSPVLSLQRFRKAIRPLNSWRSASGRELPHQVIDVPYTVNLTDSDFTGSWQLPDRSEA